MVGLSLAWRIDRPKQKTADRKKKSGFYFFFILPPDPIISLDLLDSQKSFTYQNLQDFARKTAVKFCKLCLKAQSTYTLRNKKLICETFFFFFLPTDRLNISRKR